MILNFDMLVEKYKLEISGIIHIGAHYGLEYECYKKHNVENIIMFEPQPGVFSILESNLNGKGVILVNCALGSIKCQKEMFVETANQGQSSSIMKPVVHSTQYPHIRFDNKIEIQVERLDEYLILNNLTNKYNFINMDVQGYEMEVLKGSTKTLNDIKYIMTEVNRDELYENCARVEELDAFLEGYGFSRVETDWAGGTWGDAFYIKN